MILLFKKWNPNGTLRTYLVEGKDVLLNELFLIIDEKSHALGYVEMKDAVALIALVCENGTMIELLNRIPP